MNVASAMGVNSRSLMVMVGSNKMLVSSQFSLQILSWFEVSFTYPAWGSWITADKLLPVVGRGEGELVADRARVRVVASLSFDNLDPLPKSWYFASLHPFCHFWHKHRICNYPFCYSDSRLELASFTYNIIDVSVLSVCSAVCCASDGSTLNN